MNISNFRHVGQYQPNPSLYCKKIDFRKNADERF